MHDEFEPVEKRLRREGETSNFISPLSIYRGTDIIYTYETFIDIFDIIFQDKKGMNVMNKNKYYN